MTSKLMPRKGFSIPSKIILCVLTSACLLLGACAGETPQTTANIVKTTGTAEATDVENPTEPSESTTGDKPTQSEPEASVAIQQPFVVCIDPGHQEKGNSDTEPLAPGSTVLKAKVSSGTRGTTSGVPEYKLVLALGMALQIKLEGSGISVVMTRETNAVNISNVERAEIANNAQADLYIRIHADGSENSGVSGISVLVPGDAYIADEELLEKSKGAGKMILAEMVSTTGAKNRGISVRNDMTGFNWANVPMVLVEAGFMTNPEEDRLLNTPDYQERLVAAMHDGIIQWLTRASD